MRNKWKTKWEDIGPNYSNEYYKLEKILRKKDYAKTYLLMGSIYHDKNLKSATYKDLLKKIKCAKSKIYSIIEHLEELEIVKVINNKYPKLILPTNFFNNHGTEYEDIARKTLEKVGEL